MTGKGDLQASHAMLPDGRRLHLHHGPMDLIVEAWGAPEEVAASYRQAVGRFETMLTELVAELALLRSPVAAGPCPLRGVTARAMWRATAAHLPRFVTPMAAVAGAVADEVLAAMTRARHLRRAYVNNGGDIALQFAPSARSRESRATAHICAPSILTCSGVTRASTAEDEMAVGCPVGPRVKREDVTGSGAECTLPDPTETFRIGLVVDPEDPRLPGSIEITRDMPVRGVATSGRHGRSFSLGIADSVTVLGRTAAEADAAATLIANAVDLPGHASVKRAPACSLAPDSDLGERLVTIDVGPLSGAEIDKALAAGMSTAEAMVEDGLIHAAVLVLGRTVRLAGQPGADIAIMNNHTGETRIDA